MAGTSCLDCIEWEKYSSFKNVVRFIPCKTKCFNRGIVLALQLINI